MLWFAFKHPKTPWVAKCLLAITVAYALSPVDLIPDFIPVLGYLDDVILLPAFIALAIHLIPQDVRQICKEQAQQMQMHKMEKAWYYAIPIVVFWVVVIGWLGYRIVFR